MICNQFLRYGAVINCYRTIYAWKLDANSPESEYPSCLQTTLASLPLQKSSQTVPQALALHTSTRPSIWLTPPTSLTSPSTQTRGGEGGGRGEG